jgi:superfamily II RNA helicase
MVKLCKDKFPSNDKYEQYFNTFPFELSDFQKYSIEAIVENNHILVTAHTGSGKTLPAEFAIEYLVGKGKKVIYTSPIKALSNQKFHEFSKKFPNISFGILTGDIKFNPEADVLIMTTEILRNSLLQKNTDNKNISLQFEMDFNEELGAVIFDEVHYINDADRGKVWEETIMFLPNHIQLIMLSATIDKPTNFANWIETVKSDDINKKIVYLAPTDYRVVPLKHYLYTTIPQGPFKHIKDKEFIKYINQFLHKPIEIKDNKHLFNDENYNRVKKFLEYTSKNNCYIKPPFVLNEITKYLNDNNMLPAICFVFSRKQVERFAQCINVSLFEEDSTIPSTIRHECKQILRKLPNHKEYTNLPEFDMIIKLLEKGVAIHHSGVLPIFREMIELLFSKGYIKLLFATETFAVGINMPTKTVIFTGFEKFNGSTMRLLYPHEYTQMAGRAGRRGLDTIGHVIHLNNLFSLPYQHDYTNLLNGKPQLLQSKFKISYNLILNFHQYNNDTLDFASKSMCYEEIDKDIISYTAILEQLQTEYNNKIINPICKAILENREKYEEHITLTNEIKNCKQKIRKQIQKKIENIEQDNKQFKNELQQYNSIVSMENNIKNQKDNIDQLKNHFHATFNDISSFLQNMEFLGDDFVVNDKGICATYIQETHCLAFIEYFYKYDQFKQLSSMEIAALLSCFANIRVKDDNKVYDITLLKTNNNVINSLTDIKYVYEKYITEESKLNMSYSENLDLMFEMVVPILDWCNSDNEETCKFVINKCEAQYDIFTGEFIKTILKINNMTNELKNVAEYLGNIELLHKLQKIPELTLKFIATNQSLYV